MEQITVIHQEEEDVRLAGAGGQSHGREDQLQEAKDRHGECWFWVGLFFFFPRGLGETHDYRN